MKQIFDEAQGVTAVGAYGAARLARVDGGQLWHGGMAEAPLEGSLPEKALRVTTAIPGTTNIGQGATIPTDLGEGSLSIGNRIFLDTDGDGVFTKYVDQTIGDVLVSLYRDVDGDGVADGEAVATSTTCGCGLYGFTGLAAGDYIVVIGQANFDSALAGLYSLAGAGDANDGVDADDNGYASALGIQSGTIHLTADMAGGGTWSVDFGFTDVVPTEPMTMAALDQDQPMALGNDDECVPSPEDGIFCDEDPGGGFYVNAPAFFTEDQERTLKLDDIGFGMGSTNPASGRAAYFSSEGFPFLHFYIDGVDQNGWVSIADVTAGRVTVKAEPNYNATHVQTARVHYFDANSNFLTSTPYSYLYVTAVNDAPVGQDRAVTIVEDESYAFGIADFPLTDIEGHSLASVHITSVPAGGALLLDSDGDPATPPITLQAGDVVTAAQIAAGRLTYVPAADGNGGGYGSFTFQVEDNGPRGGYNVYRDTTPRTFTIDVTNTPDLPAAMLPDSLTYIEGSGAQLLAPDAAVFDPDGNWGGGKLVVSGLLPSDRVTIASTGTGPGEVSVSGANVYYEGVLVGSILGGNGSGFVLTFGGTATNAAVQAVVRSLSYASTSDTPVTHDLSLNLFDSTGGSLNGWSAGMQEVFGADNPIANLKLYAPAFGDLDGDGDMDYVSIGAFGLSPALQRPDGSFEIFSVGDSHPLFGIGQDMNIMTVAMVDADGDGDQDIVLTTAQGFVWVEQLAPNTWGEPFALTYPVPGHLGEVTASFVDFDGDGDADLILGDVTGTIHYYRNDGGNFVAQTGADNPFPRVESDGITLRPVVVDIDADGDFDLLINQVFGGTLFVYRNEGGRFVMADPGDDAFAWQDFGQSGVGDFDNDGDLDLYFTTEHGARLFRNETPPGHRITINAVGVNDAPVGADNARTIAEDGSYVFLTGDFPFTDVEGDALAGVRITTLPENGTLLLDGVALEAGDTVTAAEIAAGALVFVPVANGNGAGHGRFTFQVQDDGGTANGGTDLDSIARSFTIDVTPVNDAPQGVDATVTLLEDGSHTLTLDDLAFTDVEGDLLLAVRIASLPDAGTLLLDGEPVAEGALVSRADIVAGKLVFVPAANANGASYADFTVQVQDDGGTANGGIDLDPTPRAIRFDVTPVNDAPTGADATRTLQEDGDYIFAADDFGFTDGDGDTLAELIVTTLPGAGTLWLDGVAVTQGQEIDAAAILAGLLRYTPPADANGSALAGFDFRLRDDGGTDDGGVDLSPDYRFTFDVTPVNDAPTAQDGRVTLDEDGVHILGADDFGFQDRDGDALDGVRIATLPVEGSLTLDGVAVTENQLITAAEIAAGKLRYTPAADGDGAGYASLSFRVIDDGGTANGGADTSTPHSLTFDVTAINDAPVVRLNGATADAALELVEGDRVFIAPDAVVIDVDADGVAGGVLTVSIGGPADAADRLSILEGAIQLIDDEVRIDGVLVGHWRGGVGGEELVVELSAEATPAQVRTLLAAIRYTNIGDTPLDTRVVTVLLTDAAGEESAVARATIAIAAVDDPVAPQEDLATVAENASVVIDVRANDMDPDGGPAETITEIDGRPIALGETVTLQSGARVTLNEDGTLTYDPNGAYDWLISAERAAATGAWNGQIDENFAYTLSGGRSAMVSVTLTGVDSAGDALLDTPGDDVLNGGQARNFFDLSMGGSDTATGGAANDAFFMGDQLSAGDRLDGGDGGDDQIGLLGNTNVVLHDDTFRNIETLVVMSGRSIPVREGAPPVFQYDITSANGNVAAGQRLTINANLLGPNESIRFDGSAETDGSFLFYAGQGNDTIIGGARADAFFFGNGERFTGNDRVDGGAGDDQLGLRGDYSGQVVLQADTMRNIETLVLISASDTRHGGGGTAFSYDLVLHDGNVAAGALLVVNGNGLGAGERMLIDGSAENDGRFRFIGGAGDDVLIGGAGDDEFYGRLGADIMTGGGGNDRFCFRSLVDSTPAARDHITDFDAGDRIDLSAIDANVHVDGNDGFAFIGDADFSNVAGELRVFADGGYWFVEGDVDGDGVADFSIQLTTANGHVPGAGDFIL